MAAAAYNSRKARREIRQAGRHQPCWRCGRALDLDQDRWESGHVVAVAEGGSNHRSNLAPECWSCNRSHGGKLGKARQTAARNLSRRIRAW